MAVAAALLLAVIGIFIVIYSKPSSSPILEVSGVSYAGKHLIKAKRSLTVTEVRVEAGATVTFQAGESVALGDGFSVGEGATLAVAIVQPP